MRGNIYDRLSERREREERLERERLEAEAEASNLTTPVLFFTNEISFVRPEELKDKTFHVFSAADNGPSPLSVVIGRSNIGTDSDLEALTQDLLSEINKSLPHLHWIDYPTPTEVSGIEARRMEYKWRQQGEAVYQIQFLFLTVDERGSRLLMQMTATSNNPKGMPSKERELFDSIVNSVQLRSAHDTAVSSNE